ncbi:MAG: lipopolysaccharide biosynthesis protein [Candidatus Acidiferrales bacterium]
MIASGIPIPDEMTPPLGEVQRQPLKRNFAWTVAGNVIYAGCQWAMLVAIAKLGTAEMVGQFALGLAVSAPVYMLTNLNLRAAQATDSRHEYRFGHYLAVRLAGTLVALTVIAAIVGFSRYRRETALVIAAVTLAKASESVSDLLYGLWETRERFSSEAVALIGRGLGAVIALGVALFLTKNLMLAVLAYAGWWAAWLLSYERSTAKHILASGTAPEALRPAWEPQRLKELAVLSFPLGAVMLLISLNANIPRYLVEYYWGEAALGYFAALAYIQVAGTMVVNALGQSAAPRLAHYYLSDRKAYVRLLGRMVAFAALLGLSGVGVALAFGKPLLRLLYRAEYAAYADVFVWVMVAGSVLYMAGAVGFAYTATRRFRSYLLPFGLNTLVGTVAAPFLVKAAGLTGAALTVLLVASGQLLATALLLRSALAEKRPAA